MCDVLFPCINPDFNLELSCLPLKRLVVAAFYKKSTSLQWKSWRQICTVHWNVLLISSWQTPCWPWYQKKHNDKPTAQHFCYWTLPRGQCYYQRFIEWPVNSILTLTTQPVPIHLFPAFFLCRALLCRPALKMSTIRVTGGRHTRFENPDLSPGLQANASIKTEQVFSTATLKKCIFRHP